MAKQIIISNALPIRFRKVVSRSDRYNTWPFDLEPTPNTPTGYYKQPWQIDDNTFIQILSDYTPTDNGLKIEVYKCGVGKVGEIAFTERPETIENQTFRIYEAEFDFSDWGLGDFYAYISYTDDDSNLIRYCSDIWETRPVWSKSLLIKYYNTRNNYGIVFTTDIQFYYRMPASWGDYNPQIDSETYVDQEYTNTLLSATPWDQRVLQTEYLPTWALQKLANILCCNRKEADEQKFELIDNAKLETEYPNNGYKYGRGSIDVQLLNDFFLQEYNVDDTAMGEYTLITKRISYIDNAENRTLTGVMKLNAVLRRIDIINKGLNIFTLRVGATPAGTELGEIRLAYYDGDGLEVPMPVVSIDFKVPFDSNTTIYITGLTGTLTNLFVIYDYDDEPDVNIDGGETTNLYAKNTFGWWFPLTSDDLNNTWDLASGLGKPGTRYSNCAICDGRNGTPNMSEAYATAIDIANTANLGNTVGANEKAITNGNLPPHSHGMFKGTVSSTDLTTPDPVAYQRNNGISRDYIMAASPGGEPDRGRTSNVGSGTPFNVRPKSIYFLPFLAIA